MLVSLAVNLKCCFYTNYCTVAELGNPGWDWEGLQPYYKKVRSTHSPVKSVD
jgi:hypothetical protein